MVSETVNPLNLTTSKSLNLSTENLSTRDQPFNPDLEVGQSSACHAQRLNLNNKNTDPNPWILVHRKPNKNEKLPHVYRHIIPPTTNFGFCHECEYEKEFRQNHFAHSRSPSRKVNHKERRAASRRLHKPKNKDIEPHCQRDGPPPLIGGNKIDSSDEEGSDTESEDIPTNLEPEPESSSSEEDDFEYSEEVHGRPIIYAASSTPSIVASYFEDDYSSRVIFEPLHGSMIQQDILDMYELYGYGHLITWGITPHTVKGTDDTPTPPPPPASRKSGKKFRKEKKEKKVPETFTRDSLFRAAVDAPASVAPQDKDLHDLLSTISNVSSGSEDPDVENWTSHLENLVILGYQMSKATSFTDVFVSVVGYIKMNTNRSVIKDIMKMIDDVLAPLEEAASPENCNDKLNDVHMNGNDVVRNWELFKGNTIFTKVSYLISAAMSLSVCNIKQIEWSPLGLQLVAFEACKEQMKAVDVIDAVIHTFTWFADTGCRCIEQRSLMPLLYQDNKMQAFNVECDYLLAHADSYLSGNKGDISDYDHRVQKTLAQVSALKATQTTGPTALWLQSRYYALIQIQQRIIAKHKNTAIKFAAFGLCCTGPTSVGKSTLAKILMKVALNAMDFSTDEKRIITIDTYDKFDTLFTSDILGFYLDDIGNTKSTFATRCPTEMCVKFFNNMAAQAVKAELNQKGVVFLGPKVGIATSNVEDMDVRSYTNCAESILRRFFFIRVHIKDKYQKPGSTMLNKSHPDLVNAALTHDIWRLTIEETVAFETKEGKSDYRMRTMDVRVKDGSTIHCEDLDFAECLDVVIALAEQHKIEQDSLVERDKGYNEMTLCKTCKRPTSMCTTTCQGVLDRAKEEAEDVEPNMFNTDAIQDVVATSIRKATTDYLNAWFAPVMSLNNFLGYSPAKYCATRKLAGEMTKIFDQTATPYVVSLTPQWVFDTSLFQQMVDVWYARRATYDIAVRVYRFNCMFFPALLWLLYRKSWRRVSWCLVLYFFLSIIAWSYQRARRKKYKEEYLSRRNALPDYAESIRDGKALKGLFVVSTLAIGLKMFQMWNKTRTENIPNSSNEQDDAKSTWYGLMLSRMGVSVDVSQASKRGTASQVKATLTKSCLFWGKFTRPDGDVASCNVFFPRKSVVNFPLHAFYPDNNMNLVPFENLTLLVDRHDGVGGQFTVKISRSQSVVYEGLDMVAAYVPNCPDLGDKSKWLPLSYPEDQSESNCTFLMRKPIGFHSERLKVFHTLVGHKYLSFTGGRYKSDHAKQGACMGVLILEQNDPVILGFHIGGRLPDKLGVMQTLLYGNYVKTIKQLEAIPGVILSANAGNIPTTQYGISLLNTDTIHPMSMCAKLEKDAFVDLHGSTALRCKQRSTVEKSILSDDVAEICDIPNRWHPPELEPNWVGYNATLEHIINPADMFEPDKLERCRQDWIKPMRDLMKVYSILNDVAPLTDKQAILGIPGTRFIDPMVMPTGCGFPIYGAKSKRFTDVLDEKGVLIDRIPDQEIRDEADRQIFCWENGQRAYPVTASTLKDEPTDNSKVRVFQASPVALTMNIRKYFLPIARFMQEHPTQSECAVGVNPFGKQWTELMNHANQWSDEWVVSWDYSKYDVRMSSQMTRACFACYIELAQMSPLYSDADINIMKNMIVDIVHPLVDYNGVLFTAYNMNTSGNSLTVTTNSLAGSLYVRMGFFDVYPDELCFRDCVAALTYGDDFIGSVRDGYHDFNFESYKTFLAGHKMKITLPDKSDTVVKFSKKSETDFLKRISCYIPEIGYSVGSLDESSIFKSLHANVRSTGATREEVAISCLEGAMHEWFAHGREKYELRRQQMLSVAARHDFKISALDATFDQRVDFWKQKYDTDHQAAR
ncbi:polyprotein [Marine RNA virus PAL128]|uniref:Polyprotein n=1 Tax=Marine RNA virus PAL128 TaxID=1804153 RepID=A0A140DLW6_9VIRU|nr:polyprotein [Marine RNA virus PAL128]AMK49153.1 polyprotein [Marine RNA virus PAL128]